MYGVDSSGGRVSNLISQSYYQSQPPACILEMMTIAQISFAHENMTEDMSTIFVPNQLWSLVIHNFRRKQKYQMLITMAVVYSNGSWRNCVAKVAKVDN